MGTTKRLHFHFSLSCIGEGNGNPLQCSCLENPRDRGVRWAAVSGVAESDTTDATQQQQQLTDKQTCALGCFCPHLLPTRSSSSLAPSPDSVPLSISSQNSAWHIIIISVRSASYCYYNYRHHYPCSSKPIRMDLSSCGLDFPTPPSLRPKLSGDQSQWK